MDKATVSRLQAAVGSNVDGIFGRNTLTAVFKKLGAKQALAESLAYSGVVYMQSAGILENGYRFAHWLGQLTKESGRFVYMEEIHDGSNYEGRKDLGNIYPGDGKKFKGRGPIQITGRANYTEFSKIMGLDLVTYPGLLANPCLGLWAGTLFWSRRNINPVADRNDCTAVTKIVNGGKNGLDERIKYTNLVLGWCGLPATK